MLQAASCYAVLQHTAIRWCGNGGLLFEKNFEARRLRGMTRPFSVLDLSPAIHHIRPLKCRHKWLTDESVDISRPSYWSLQADRSGHIRNTLSAHAVDLSLWHDVHGFRNSILVRHLWADEA